jgi:DNA-binding response OmpR family regulator
MEKKKILIIEDELDVAKLLIARLKSAGYEVMIAADAVQGVQFTHKEKPDLIILDLMLPAGDGLLVLENIRLSAYSKYIPVVILTGVRNEEYKNKAMEKEVEAYFEKPYNPDELIKSIKDILKV